MVALSRRCARWRSVRALGLDISLDGWGEDPFRTLFNEELGAVVQIACEDRAEFADLVSRHGLIDCAQRIAKPTAAPMIRVRDDGSTLAEWRWEELFDAWWATSHALQKLRDNPECADEERAVARDFYATGLRPKLAFDPSEDVAAPYINLERSRSRDPARAGCQRPDRDGIGIRSCRLRGRRRAHERPDQRPHCA